MKEKQIEIQASPEMLGCTAPEFSQRGLGLRLIGRFALPVPQTKWLA